MNCTKISLKPIALLLAVLLLVITSNNCKKEPETITETVYVTDTLVVTDTVVVIDTLENFIPMDSGTVLFLVRHAETTGGGTNPHLSITGMERAERLNFMLQNNALSGIYATNFFRTSETAAPVAVSAGLTTTTYDAGNLNAFATQLLNNHKGEKVLVVGHSNTTPDLLNILLNTNDWQQFNDTVYDNFFVVYKSDLDASVTHLKY